MFELLFDFSGTRFFGSYEDPLIPFDHGKKTHSLINNSKFIALEGVGHEFVKEQYEFIASEIYNHIINIKGEADE